MTVTVRVPGMLRELVGGQALLTVDVPPQATVGAVLDRLAEDFPALERRVRDERGIVRKHVNVFVGETNVRDATVCGTPVPDGVEISILPCISGG